MLLLNQIKILTIYLALISTDVSAQSKLEEELTGTWSVVKFTPLAPDPRPEVQNKVAQMEKAFREAKFVFRNDHSFDLNIAIEELAIMNGYWRIVSSDRVLINESNQPGAGSIMSIKVTQKEGKFAFEIEDIFYAFDVKKD